MIDEFLDLLAVDPAAGHAKASAAVSDSTNVAELAFAHRALAVAARDSGDQEGTQHHLRKALNFGKRSMSSMVFADVLATRGGTQILLGDPRAGFRDLSKAAEMADGLLLGKILYRRGVANSIIGRHPSAASDALDALEIFRKHEDQLWLGSALQLLAECEARLGQTASAAAHLDECRRLIGEEAGLESIRLRMLGAWVAFLRGDLPAALSEFLSSDITEINDGYVRVRVAMDVATIHIAAGLVDSALEVLESVELAETPPILAAECRGMLARTLLELGQHDRASVLAADAADALTRMGLGAEGAEAELTALNARIEISLSGESVALAERIAENLTSSGSRSAVEGWLTAARLAKGHGEAGRSARAYRAAASFRGESDLLIASSGWLARAHEIEAGDTASHVLRACSRGLDALDEYREIMGSSEVRASLTHRGRELAVVALRHAKGDPRALLTWSERWRATSLAKRPVTPQGEVSPTVAMLRDSGRLLAEAKAAGEPTEALEKERRHLERKARSEHHQLRADAQTVRSRFSASELVAKVGDRTFIELVDVDGSLHVLVVSKGRVRRVIAGKTKSALELADAGRFALRRAARTSRFAPGDLGQRLEETVLGKAVRMLPDGPVTVSPTAALHGAPFALMPALTDRPFSIVPSAAQWLRASDVPEPRRKRRALVAGPNLRTGGSEVARLAKRYPDATVLTNQAATVEATMNAIDGAHLAHLATHGTFRADSPLFSALEMADGPLSVYELERLKRAPYRTILSACDSGVLAPVGAQEVLGLASALFSLGSAGLVCSIAEVNDEMTADLMMDVHAELDAGRTPAEALAKVRAEADPIKLATTSAFVALGV